MAITAPFREAVPGDISTYDVATGEDLSECEYCAVQLTANTNRTVELWETGNMPVGILCNRPVAVDQADRNQFSTEALVQWRGKALVKAGAIEGGQSGLVAGDLVKLASGGVGVKATPSDGDIIIGQCEVGADAGYPATVRLNIGYVSTGA